MCVCVCAYVCLGVGMYKCVYVCLGAGKLDVWVCLCGHMFPLGPSLSLYAHLPRQGKVFPATLTHRFIVRERGWDRLGRRQGHFLQSLILIVLSTRT
jgi:hypothetical protein